MVATAILFHHRVQDHPAHSKPCRLRWGLASGECHCLRRAGHGDKRLPRGLASHPGRGLPARFETGRAALAALPADPDTGQAVRHLAEVVARFRNG